MAGDDIGLQSSCYDSHNIHITVTDLTLMLLEPCIYGFKQISHQNKMTLKIVIDFQLICSGPE